MAFEFDPDKMFDLCAMYLSKGMKIVRVEGIWPNNAFEGGIGINALTGADPIPPFGGGAFHDTAVWLRPAREGSGPAGT